MRATCWAGLISTMASRVTRRRGSLIITRAIRTAPRAADSLLNLAEAMRQQGDDNRACIALNEFAATYAAEARGRLRPDYAQNARRPDL